MKVASACFSVRLIGRDTKFEIRYSSKPYPSINYLMVHTQIFENLKAKILRSKEHCTISRTEIIRDNGTSKLKRSIVFVGFDGF